MAVIAGWILILLACLLLVFELPMLYLLMTGDVAPGQPAFMGDPAPTKEQSLMMVMVSMGIVVAGFVLKEFAGRYRRGKAS